LMILQKMHSDMDFPSPGSRFATFRISDLIPAVERLPGFAQRQNNELR